MLSVDLHPYTILVGIFCILLIKQAVGRIGKSTIQEFVWLIYLKLSSNQAIRDYNAKKVELHDVNKQKRAISAQDEYAKWTKLNRQADKLTAEIQSLNEEIHQLKASIDKAANLLLMVLTTLPIWVSRIFFRKTHLFYLRKGMFPAYIEWALALPFLPSGTVGLTVWMFASNSVISNLISLVAFAFEKKVDKPVREKKVVETN
ncbi:Golgi to ER traffic protein 1 [Candida viswanathii]|uniref:Golgi to ER traffic protein 1 n=1 Tax=Candida viswanathii TaxID=5486 RepID=A0A367YPB4_9ASCO|nr:Golgi to ER traffic protein 1 [Candida viswanathii]